PPSLAGTQSSRRCCGWWSSASRCQLSPRSSRYGSTSAFSTARPVRSQCQAGELRRFHSQRRVTCGTDVTNVKPSASHRESAMRLTTRVAAALTAAALAIASLTATAAADPRDDKKKADQQVRTLGKELATSSARLEQAETRYPLFQAQSPPAQA